MSYLHTIAPPDAEGDIQNIYSMFAEKMGYIPNYTLAFSHRPDVYTAWTHLIAAIRGHMRLRRYELVTLAAAQALQCDYCVLAHGHVLRSQFFSDGELIAILTDFRNADLAVDEVAIMAFAQKVVQNAHEITRSDIDTLRQHKLEDDEILDIILAAAARSFFSTVLNAVGAAPDTLYSELRKMLHTVMPVGLGSG